MTEASSDRPGASRWWLAAPFLIAIAITAAIAAIIIRNHDGQIAYVSDVASVHLALSDQIRALHYGVEPETASAPVDSILWPALMAPASGTPAHVFMPFAINALALLGSLGLLAALFGRMGQYRTKNGYAYAAGFITIAIVFLNVIPLVFTGTPHMTALFFMLLTLHGLARFVDEGRMPWWLPIGIVVGPLIQYACLPVSIGAIAAVALRKRFAAASICVLALVILVGGYSIFLNQLGVGWLPAAAYGHIALDRMPVWQALLDNANQQLAWIDGRAVAVLCALLIVQMIWNRREPNGLIQLVTVFALMGHIFLGKSGSYGWHETPIIVFAFAAFIYSHHIFFKRLANQTPVSRVMAALIVTILLIWPYNVTNLYYLAHTAKPVESVQLAPAPEAESEPAAGTAPESASPETKEEPPADESEVEEMEEADPEPESEAAPPSPEQAEEEAPEPAEEEPDAPDEPLGYL